MGRAIVPGQLVLNRSFRWGMPMVISALTLWLLAEKVAPADVNGILQTVRHVSAGQLLSAVLLSALSFCAIGRYDLVAHRHMQSGINDKAASRSGIAAVALAQTLGFGLITGALVRWRMLPSLNMSAALRLSGFVCLSFLGALAVLIALVCLILPAPAGAAIPAIGVCLALPVVLWILFRHPVLKFRHMTLRLPSLTAAGAILIWAALDTTAAAAAFYVLLPESGPSFAVLLPAFLIALAVALLSGAPGGVGPFELALLALLPHMPAPDLLGAVLLFRAVYYALPATLALMACVAPHRPKDWSDPETPLQAPSLWQAKRAEVGVIRQNGGTLLLEKSAAHVVWPTAQSHVGLFDPLAGDMAVLLPALQNAARRENKLACLYKITAPTALVARAAGWQVTRIAQEAVLSPAGFDINTPSRRGLRRKLRQADKAGVMICKADVLPLLEMSKIDRAWQSRRGAARAGTMGCFGADYLAAQRVFLAYQRGRLVGFVSFHTSAHEWCLDLMRSVDDAPDGTMQASICHALDVAGSAHVPRLSLAAVPDVPALQTGPAARLWQAAATRHCAKGLRQFKASFAPRWQPLYAAAPGRTALWLSLLDIARAIHHPTRTASAHNEDEYNEVAPILAS